MLSPVVDMHCHLDLYPDPRAQIQLIARQKNYVLSVTTTPKAWRVTSALAAGHPRIKTALGLHPQLAKERKSELNLFDQLLPEARYVGEVGLDGGPDCRTFWKDQILVFDHILASCVAAGGRILTLHSRAAASAVLDALERHPGHGVAVLHWFSGTQRELARAVEMGCWFSVGSAMLRSKKGVSLAAKMPFSRVLTETDGPFAAIAGKPLQPADCSGAVEALARLWDVDEVSAREKIVLSFRELVSSIS
jgi:TatD DNase family protein